MHTHTGTCRKDQTKQRTQTLSTTQTNGPFGESIANTHHSSGRAGRDAAVARRPRRGGPAGQLHLRERRADAGLPSSSPAPYKVAYALKLKFKLTETGFRPTATHPTAHTAQTQLITAHRSGPAPSPPRWGNAPPPPRCCSAAAAAAPPSGSAPPPPPPPRPRPQRPPAPRRPRHGRRAAPPCSARAVAPPGPWHED